MKKLFLLPVIALVAILVAGSVNALSCCQYTDDNYERQCINGVSSDVCYYTYSSTNWHRDGYQCNPVEGRKCTEVSGCSTGNCPYPKYCSNNVCVPEFGTIGMGIALIGAGAGYALIRRKRK